ncbi:MULTISPECIES: DUF4190 domain-containing protein [unclassified Arthrobacter]|uniref:DUF4190 domain-containing protein n=1 Tax=unclassified Arthrobacter TaxID=235627 RepID=UPI001D56548B|nr:DUF4190 domain-containing protein [Arthrobacter sp. Bi26]CAH0284906.1 hypothetical protein SRABI26_04050 [Arthrobacter sp. Bi26]
MTEQPKQGKDETPEGYQPTLRLPDHQPDFPPEQAPPASKDHGQSATQQFAQPGSGQQPYAGAQPGSGQQPDTGQQPHVGQQPHAGQQQPGQQQPGQAAPGHGQFSSPYPPIYGESDRAPYAAGQPGYGQAAYNQPAPPYGQPSPYAQPGSPNAYGQPAYYGAPAAPKSLSIASMCCGIAALVGFGFFLLPQLAAVILGHLALRREPAGRGMAIAGLVMGYVGIAVTILVLVIFGLVIGTARNSGYGV